MKESILIDVFLQASFFLALSALIIPFLRSFNVPVALGYLLAGIVFGPYGMGALTDEFQFLRYITLQDTIHVKMLAELGIVLLLFVIGLELTPQRLWQMRNLVFGLGGTQVLLSALVIGTITSFWGNNFQVSLLIGLSLALSSTAMITQWLHEQKLFITKTGRVSFSILLLQDLAVIPILFLLTIFSTNTNDGLLSFTVFSLIKMCAAVLAIYFIGKQILKPVFIFANRHGGTEVFVALSLLVITVSASVAGLAGLSMALGAFIAGLLLADTEYSYEISAIIVPFKSMLLGIFFLSFGMGIDLNFIAEKPMWLFLSVIGLMLVKASIIYVLCRVWKQPQSVSIESAVLLSQAGEFGLLVIGTALSLGIMAQDVGQFMLITVGLTMFLTPMVTPLARKIGLWAEAHYLEETTPNNKLNENMVNHVAIFGLGRMGQMIGEILSQEALRIIGFDSNVDRVNDSRKKSLPVHFGNATRKSTLDAAQVDKAICVVITIDDPVATSKIVKNIRKRNAAVPIMIRAHKLSDFKKLSSAEYVYVVPEYLSASLNLTNEVLKQCGYKEEEISCIIKQAKEKI